jgi:hypothetical protein
LKSRFFVFDLFCTGRTSKFANSSNNAKKPFFKFKAVEKVAKKLQARAQKKE